MKDSEVADILFDTLVHVLIITILGLARVSSSDRNPEPLPYAMAMSHVVPSHNSGLTPVISCFQNVGLCVIRS